MAYFVVIGTDNKMRRIVDGIRESHQQYDVITAGCIEVKENGMYYRWDAFNADSDELNDDVGSLHEALSNQIAQFRLTLPPNETTNILIVTSCFSKDDVNRLKMVCSELNEIVGTIITPVFIDIVIIGYDIDQCKDVTIRPSWKVLKDINGIENWIQFQSRVLYINNIDIHGAATNVDGRLLGRFLRSWSIMISTRPNPMGGIFTNFYAIGMAERQYDVNDLQEFFNLAVEEEILKHALDAKPSEYAQSIYENTPTEIDTTDRKLNGLTALQSQWKEYFETQYDFSRSFDENIYSLDKQRKELTAYLNCFLRAHINKLKEQLETSEQELNDDADDLKNEIEKISFPDYRDVPNPHLLITGEEKTDYETKRSGCEKLESYLLTDDAAEIIKSVAMSDEIGNILPFPETSCNSVGHLNPITPIKNSPDPIPTREIQETDNQPKQGCLLWFTSLFNKRADNGSSATPVIDTVSTSSSNVDHVSNIIQALKALRQSDKVQEWWEDLNSRIKQKQRRKKECRYIMDGVDSRRVNKYHLKSHHSKKSVSLIELGKVRNYRDTNRDFRDAINRVIERWFNPTEDDEKLSLNTIIQEELKGIIFEKYKILNWDGENPFAKEIFSDEEISSIINDELMQSNPFVEYRLIGANQSQNITCNFYTSNPKIVADPNEFRNKYHSGNASIVPVLTDKIQNIMCVVQVMPLNEHIDQLSDFHPRMQYNLPATSINFNEFIGNIIGNADSNRGKSKAIFDWLCKNIAYDTTKNIHDADKAWRTKRGTCQAYCELFCHLGNCVGLTVEIITGLSKDSDGNIHTEKHAWIYVYEREYKGILIDPTWGAGHISEGRFIRNDNPSLWFDISPHWMIYSHFPDSQEWTNIEIEILEDVFRALPFRMPTSENGQEQLLSEIDRINSSKQDS